MSSEETWRDNMPWAEQIRILADFIIEHYPGEPSQSGGAIETAIRLMRRDHEDAKRYKAALERIENHVNPNLPSGRRNPDYSWDHVTVSVYAGNVLRGGAALNPDTPATAGTEETDG